MYGWQIANCYHEQFLLNYLDRLWAFWTSALYIAVKTLCLRFQQDQKLYSASTRTKIIYASTLTIIIDLHFQRKQTRFALAYMAKGVPIGLWFKMLANIYVGFNFHKQLLIINIKSLKGSSPMVLIEWKTRYWLPLAGNNLSIFGNKVHLKLNLSLHQESSTNIVPLVSLIGNFK